MNSDRDLVKRECGVLFNTVSAVLFEVDPVGIRFEDNCDEYDPEAGTIVPRLREAGSGADLLSIVHEEFCRSFGPDIAGPKQAYVAASERIWKLWSAFVSERAQS